jgi:hypothetical protein
MRSGYFEPRSGEMELKGMLTCQAEVVGGSGTSLYVHCVGPSVPCITRNLLALSGGATHLARVLLIEHFDTQYYFN